MTTHTERTESQNAIVRRLLKAGKKLTPRIMYERYSIMRLAARILDCKRDGMEIKSELIQAHPIKFSRYSLVKK